jgi:hypothetical protein
MTGGPCSFLLCDDSTEVIIDRQASRDYASHHSLVLHLWFRVLSEQSDSMGLKSKWKEPVLEERLHDNERANAVG